MVVEGEHSLRKKGRDVLTFGHGKATEEELAALIRGAGITRVVDVRSVPKSRVHPHVWAERLALWIPAETGATYQWERELGGFRKPNPHSPNVALRHPSFRGYADYMRTPQFVNAIDKLVETSKDPGTAIMCSESVWWRCHRRLIADALVLTRGIDVWHPCTMGGWIRTSRRRAFASTVTY